VSLLRRVVSISAPVLILCAGLAVCGALAVSSQARAFHFVILGDRTGETVPGVFEQVIAESAATNPAFFVTTGDTIQGLNDNTAESEWREARRLLGPFRRFTFYLVPGNHDIWSDASEALYTRYSRRPLHYSFDYAQAHFTMLDNSRSDQLSPAEENFLEEDLRAHAAQPVKFIVSHRPSWIFNVMLRDNGFPLHRLARKYGVKYVVAGHVHQILRFELDGVTYLSMPSAGGHLRASKKYEDGWFFGYADVAVDGAEARFRFHELRGRTSALTDWGGPK
jgi:Icc protein